MGFEDRFDSSLCIAVQFTGEFSFTADYTVLNCCGMCEKKSEGSVVKTNIIATDAETFLPG
jgi:hypothetical protein